VKPTFLSELMKGPEENNVLCFESKSINFLNKMTCIDWNK